MCFLELGQRCFHIMMRMRDHDVCAYLNLYQYLGCHNSCFHYIIVTYFNIVRVKRDEK